MRVDVLGPVRAVRGDDVLDLGAPRARAVLAALALSPGRVVSVDRIVDLVWGEHPPPGVTGTLQAYVSGLRRVLEPDRARGTNGSVLATEPGGYALHLGPDDLDAARFAAAVLDVRRRLGPSSALVPAAGAAVPAAVEVAELAGRLDEALGLWRGEPYAELDDAEEARAERSRLTELRLVALEDRAVLDLWTGQDAAVAAALEPLSAASPWRERLWGLHALALARTGRQADALAVLATLRTTLDEELGIEPGPELRALQTAVLRQDPALAWAVAPGPAQSAHAAPGALPAERWPLVGRDAELTTLLDALAAARDGDARFVGLVGEAGIGKSRLLRELGRRAQQQGFAVVSGRCSADEGAPPLWPWVSVLAGLGRDLPEVAPDRADFGVWTSVVEGVVAAAGRPTVVVLDDLHWADPATLRVLRLLVEHPSPGRLLLLLTWRPVASPTGAFGDLLEALGRAHAGRVELTGLATEDVAAVVAAVAGAEPGPDHAALLRARTDGNPFFLVEYAQLAATDVGALGRLLAEPEPPTGVREVLQRRLDRLPDPALGLVRTAAVAGRHLDLDALAAVVDAAPETVLDDLDPAVTAGLLHEEAVGRFAFVHALVRDTAYASLPPTRRARSHAAWATTLEAAGGHATEVARHWAAAGPDHVPRAWRAARDAAAVAGRLHDHEQAATLLLDALRLLGTDPAATGEDRFEVLLELVEAHRWAGQWAAVVTKTRAAVALARGLGDVRRLARAATGTTRGTIWQSSAYGQTDDVVVGALRESLRGLPTADDPLRARVMLALAVETYYAATLAERDALVEEALAMAGRLADDELLLEAYLGAIAARWRPATAAQRLGWAEAARDLAARLGREETGVVAATLVATAQAELGHLDQMWVTIGQAARDAVRLHLPYSQIGLDQLAVGLEAMGGRLDAAEATLGRMAGLDRRIGTQQTHDAVGGSTGMVRRWQGRWDEVAGAIGQLARSPLPTTAISVALLLQADRREQAAALLDASPIEVDHDDWLSLHTWCHAAEVAAAFSDATLAAQVYARLAPYAGHLCMAGSGPTGGPVDGYLALAARAVGETAAAGRHARDALALMERWDLPLAAARFREQLGQA